MALTSGGIPTVEMDVHARLPPSLQISGRKSAWALRQRGSGEIGAFLEGPTLDGSGGLFVADVAWGRIFHIDADGAFSTIVEYDGQPNGMALGPDGRLLVADATNGLLEIDSPLGSPSMTVLADGYGHERFRGLNDLVVTSDGLIYVTDQGGTGLHDPTGRVLLRSKAAGWSVLLANVPSPNGIALFADSLLIAATRDNAVWRIPRRGAVTKVGRFIQLSGGEGPDGLAVSPTGEVLVAHLGLGIVWVFDGLGVPILGLRAAKGLATTNVVVDADGRVFVTESDTSTVLTASLPVSLDAVGYRP